jgi:hypothetical protein
MSAGYSIPDDHRSRRPVIEILGLKEENVEIVMPQPVAQRAFGLNFQRLLLAGVSTLFVAGCSDEVALNPPFAEPSKTALESATSGLARASIGQSGQFNVDRPESAQEISAARAAQLADAYGQDLLPYILTYITNTRGAAIQRKLLRPCGRPLYAESTFEDLEPSTPIGVREGHGAYWLVTLCAQSEPQVSVAVSALATEMGVQNRKLRFPEEYGGEFFAWGIPRGHVGEFPLAPEQAALFAAQQTGARVVDVPRLVMPIQAEGIPQSAKWEVKLDRSVPFRGATRGAFARQGTTVGVVLDGQGSERLAQFAPSIEQPAFIDYAVAEGGVEVGGKLIGNRPAVVQRTARLKSGAIVKFEAIITGGLQ